MSCVVEVSGDLLFSEGRRRGVDLEERGDLGREHIGVKEGETVVGIQYIREYYYYY